MRRTIDASVIGSVLFEEDRSAVARTLLADDCERFAPEHLFTESLSIVIKKYLQGLATADELPGHVAGIKRLPVQTTPDMSVAAQAIQLAVLMQHSVYDCLYVAVALEQNAPLVTADRALYEAVRDVGLGDHVIWLDDLA
jgi:predicted nucleic acid-binding protein